MSSTIMQNACYKCVHRGTIPGDAHTQCRHPQARDLEVEGNPHGIKSGWFLHPFNFDPVWLLKCNGFMAKTTNP